MVHCPQIKNFTKTGFKNISIYSKNINRAHNIVEDDDKPDWSVTKNHLHNKKTAEDFSLYCFSTLLV
jgi:hypothetical protein